MVQIYKRYQIKFRRLLHNGRFYRRFRRGQDSSADRPC